MSTRPDPDFVIASWLRDEARDGASDRLLAATRRQLESTNQRRAWWPAWRFNAMNTPVRVALAAAAVVAVAAVGTRLLPSGTGPGGPASPIPTTPPASPTITPAPSLAFEGPMPAGTYFMEPFGPPNASTRVVFTVPDGFDYAAGWAIIPTDIGPGAPSGIGIGFLQPAGIFSDPCKWDVAGTATFPQPGDIAIGPTADDLVTALATNQAYVSGEPTPVTIGGYSGKRIDLQLPSDIDFAACDKYVGATEGSYFVWGTLHPGGSNLYAQGPGNRLHVSALDVAGNRIVVETTDYVGTSQRDRDRVQAIVDSIHIEP
jgi:hypothetical protein